MNASPAPSPLPSPDRDLGRGINRILAAVLVLSLVATVYLLMQNHDVFFLGLLATILSAFALVALPAVLYVVYARRLPGLAITRTMRAAVVFSGLCLMASGAWVVYVVWPVLWLAAVPALVAAFGAFVTVRVWRAPPSGPEQGPRLAYGGSTVAGAFVMLLALASLPKFACSCGEPAYHATLKSDLRNLVVMQEAFLLDHERFASSGPALDSLFRPMVGVNISVLARGDSSWYAVANHTNHRDVCGIWVGAPPPDGMHGAAEGEPACWKR